MDRFNGILVRFNEKAMLKMSQALLFDWAVPISRATAPKTPKQPFSSRQKFGGIYIVLVLLFFFFVWNKKLAELKSHTRICLTIPKSVIDVLTHYQLTRFFLLQWNSKSCCPCYVSTIIIQLDQPVMFGVLIYATGAYYILVTILLLFLIFLYTVFLHESVLSFLSLY